MDTLVSSTFITDSRETIDTIATSATIVTIASEFDS